MLYVAQIWSDGKLVRRLLIASNSVSQSEDAIRKFLQKRHIKFDDVVLHSVAFDEVGVAQISMG